MLNFPMYAVKADANAQGSLPEEWSLITTDSENLVIETVKEAEHGKDIIVRGYEAKNFRGTANITLGFDAKEVYIADLMENKVEKLKLDGRTVRVPYKPFEIVTLRIIK